MEGIFYDATMYVRIKVARNAQDTARHSTPTAHWPVGGDSTVGLGKAIALESRLPFIALPTSYAGSEATPMYGIAEAGVKRNGSDPRVMPRVVI